MSLEAVNNLRLLLQAIIALAIEVVDNLPMHEDAPGAGIGLGILALTVAEVVIRWLNRPRPTPK
jgi:hypothetical protein